MYFPFKIFHNSHIFRSINEPEFISVCNFHLQERSMRKATSNINMNRVGRKAFHVMMLLKL